MCRGAWTWTDGWRYPFPEGVDRAIRALPRGEALTDQEVRQLAIQIGDAAILGREQEMPKNRMASARASRDELEGFIALAERLKNHVQNMRQPANNALFDGASFSLSEFSVTLAEAIDAAEVSVGAVEAPAESVKGAPKKIEANEVTARAAFIYFQVTGEKPTFSTDTSNSKVFGNWPDFLDAVFKGCRIKASVDWQVRNLAV